MAIEFNQEEYIKQIKIHKRLKELEESESKQLIESDHIYAVISDCKEKIKETEKKLKEFNTFFKRRKYKDKIVDLNTHLNSYKSTLEKKIKEINEIEENVKKIKEEIDMLENQKKDISISNSISYDNNTLTISDSDKIPLNENKTHDKVMVHCTNFFPKNKTILCAYDGNKKQLIDFEYNGDNKKVEYLSHRHTVHFTINSAVKTTEATKMYGGTWEQPKFIIIEPLKEHENQFVSALNCYSDEFTYGSVKLGDKPILMVRDDSYNEIPKEEIHNYNIIKYKGNYNSCVDNLLHILGYELKHDDANAPVHAHSDIGITENVLNNRNILINYILDNAYDGKFDINFSIDNIDNLFNIYNKKIEYMPNITQNVIYRIISEQTKIPIEFVRFCLNFGVYKNDNCYKIDDDDKMYNTKKNYDSIISKISSMNDDKEKSILIETSINYDRIRQIYIDYLKYEKEKITNINNVELEEEQNSNTKHI